MQQKMTKKHKIRIFFAQPIDFVPRKAIYYNYQELCGLLQELNVEVVAPYLEDEKLVDFEHLDKKSANFIINEDYAIIDTCDILIVDLSQKNHQPIGMVFEMAYAHEREKLIIIYSGESIVAKRIWVIAISDNICQTWEEVKNAIEKYIQYQ